MTDRELIQGCLKENRQCQYEFFQRYAAKMMTVCIRYTRHHAEAEDVLQDAFVKVYDNLHKFEYKGSLEGWVRRIVVNTALKNIQKSSFQREMIGVENVLEEGHDPDVYSHLEEQELLNLVSKLPEGYRIVFNLFAIEGFDHKEISTLLGIQESTSRSQLVKARRMLKEGIEKLHKVELDRA